MKELETLIAELQQVNLRLNNIENSQSSILNHLLKSSYHSDSETDQIRSQSRSSDQIRSDQISNSYSNGFEKFREHALSLGIDLSDIDLSSIGRNIDWYLINSNKVLSKANYIKKMVVGLPPKRKVGFTTAKPEPETEDPSKCMGLDIAMVNDRMPYMDERTYNQTKELIPNWKSLFASWDECKGNQFKLRVLTCYAIKGNKF